MVGTTTDPEDTTMTPSTTRSTTLNDHCDRDAHRAWVHRGAAPAYMRGLPTWVWQAALCRRRASHRVGTEL
jgi:hypothetical protein